jgi:hypothetical protein
MFYLEVGFMTTKCSRQGITKTEGMTDKAPIREMNDPKKGRSYRTSSYDVI